MHVQRTARAYRAQQHVECAVEMIYYEAAMRGRQRAITTRSSVRAAARAKCASSSTLPSRVLRFAQREHKQAQHATVIISAVLTVLLVISSIIVLQTIHVHIALLAVSVHTLFHVITRR